jgi:hypothetical protein
MSALRCPSRRAGSTGRSHTIDEPPARVQRRLESDHGLRSSNKPIAQFALDLTETVRAKPHVIVTSGT